MTEKKQQDQEFRLKRIDTFIAAIGALGVIASIWYGFANLTDQSKQQTTAITSEWSRKFYDEKLSIYTRATEAAGRVSSLKEAGIKDGKMQDAILEFKTLFWGPMCITEGTDVEKAMVAFNKGIEANVDPDTLEQLSLCLARICRNEAHTLYGVSQPVDENYGPNKMLLRRMKQLLPLDEPPKNAK